MLEIGPDNVSISECWELDPDIYVGKSECYKLDRTYMSGYTSSGDRNGKCWNSGMLMTGPDTQGR